MQTLQLINPHWIYKGAACLGMSPGVWTHPDCFLTYSLKIKKRKEKGSLREPQKRIFLSSQATASLQGRVAEVKVLPTTVPSFLATCWSVIPLEGRGLEQTCESFAKTKSLGLELLSPIAGNRCYRCETGHQKTQPSGIYHC